jgi:hypothetical protein
MARLVLGTVLGVVAAFGAMPPTAAQIDQIDEVTDSLEETTDQVGEVAGQEAEGALDTVESTGDSVNSAVGGSSGGSAGTVQETAGNVTSQGGSVTGTVSDSVGDSGVTSGGASGDTVNGATGQSRGKGASRSRIEPAAGTGPGSVRMVRALGESGEGWSGAVYVPLIVRLTNDADGDGSFSDAETAGRPDQDVPFQVQLQNVGSNELAILAVRNASPTPNGVEEDSSCRDLTGIRLSPGESTTCRFTVGGVAPPAGERVVRLFEVDAVDTTDPSTTGTVVDTTVIRTGGSVLGEFFRRGLNALATTGARIAVLLVGAVGLAGVGGFLVLLGNRRGQPDLAAGRWDSGNPSLPGPGLRSRAPLDHRRRGSRTGHGRGSDAFLRHEHRLGLAKRSPSGAGSQRARFGYINAGSRFRSPATQRRCRA